MLPLSVLESRMFFRRKSKDKEVAAPLPTPAPIPANPTGEPDFRTLGHALWRRKFRILAFTLIAAVAAFVVVNSITPRYRSEARVLLEAKENVFLRAEADTKIAEAFEVGVRTVERTRRLLVTEGFEAVLSRKPSPNRQYRKLDGAQEAELVKLTCSKPPAGRARWTLQLLADRLVERKVVASIGREAVRTTLQKTTSSRGSASGG